MRNTELVSRHSRHKKKVHSSPVEISDGEASDVSEEKVIRTVTLKRSVSEDDSTSSPERRKKHKKKHKKHRRKHKHLDSDVEVNSETEYQVKESVSPECTVQTIHRAHLRDREESNRRRRYYEEGRRKERSRDEYNVYEHARVKEEPFYEDSRGRHYSVPSRQRHSDRHRDRTEAAEYHSRRHHRREGGHARHDRGKTSGGHRGHGGRYHEDQPGPRDRKPSEEEEPELPSGRGRRPDQERGGRQGSKDQRRAEEDTKFNPNQAIKQERVSPETDNAEPQTFEWGKKVDNIKQEKPNGEKEKPNFGLSGKLAEETNTFNGVVIKYSEPPEARKPRRRWRFYPFKGEKALQTLYIHRQSSYLLGRDRKIADIPMDHPSCSKQHAALQYRLVTFTRENGTEGRRVRPYIIDLESANGTFVNNKRIEPRKYVELLEKDVVKFGFSSREYVLLHEHSKDDDYDDIGDLDGAEDAAVAQLNTAQ